MDYELFVRELRRFSTFEILCMCNRFANWLEEKKTLRQRFPVPLIQRFNVVPGSAILLEPSMLAFIAKESILHGTDLRHANLSKEVMLCLNYLLVQLKEAPIEPSTGFAAGALLRMYEQNRYQTEIARAIPRTRLMLIEGNRVAPPEKKPFDLDEVWSAVTGMTLEKFMMVGFGFYAGAIEHTRTTNTFPASGVLAERISSEDCLRFLSRAGATYEQFRSLSQQFRSSDPLYVKSEFNMLLQKPAVIRNREVIVPIPRLLVNRVTEGIFYDLNDALADRSKQLHDYFGYLFEQYVGRLLKWTFGDEKVFPETSYQRRKGERVDSPDWIVLDGESALIFECRSRRISLGSRVYGDSSGIEDDIQKLLTDTVRKFPRKIDDLMEGRVGLDLSHVSQVHRIVVIYDRIAFEEVIFRSAVRAQLPPTSDPTSDDYILMDIEDLETLSAWNANHPVKNILALWQDSALPRNDFADFIRRYAIDYQLPPQHPWLHEYVDEFFEWYGISREQLRQQAAQL